jgi:polysaccharide pyruvyl transferase WcaK-like protein
MKALLQGYYGWFNAGDDAFMQVCTWAARNILGYTTLWAPIPVDYPLGDHQARPIFPPKRIGPLPFPGHGHVVRRAERFRARTVDSILFGGGNLFHSAAISRRYIELMRLSRGPHRAFGIGIAPFQSKQDESACREALKWLDFIAVRDRTSYDMVLDLLPDAPVRLAFDLAPLSLLALGREAPKPPRIPATLGVSLRSPEHRPRGVRTMERSLDVLSQSIFECVRRKGVRKVCLIDMNCEPHIGDAEWHTHLARRLSERVETECVRYCVDPFRTLSVIASMSGMLATRLHAAVFAFMTQTPTVIISYHDKCDAWVDMVRHPYNQYARVRDGTIDLTPSHIEMLMESPALPKLTPREAASLSMRNFENIGR